MRNLFRADSNDDPYAATPRNVEVACSYALRAAAAWKRRIAWWMDAVSFEEAAVAAVLRARDGYDPAAGASFFTWANTKVRVALMEEDRNQRKRPEGRIETPEEEDSPAGPGLRESDVSDSASYAIHVFRMACAPDESGKSVLNVDEQKVVALRYLKGMRQMDVAELLGKSAGRICQIENAASSKMKAMLDATP